MSVEAEDLNDAAGVTPFRITDIHPEPDAETLAVITAALYAGWPRPVAAAASADHKVQDNWRFGLRRWQHRAVPRQTWGRN